MSPWKAGASKPVVLSPQGILVFVARLLGGELGIVKFEAGVIPLLHLNHGVILCGERFLGANCSYPGIDGLPVGAKQLVKVQILHDCERRIDSALRQLGLATFHRSLTNMPVQLMFFGLSHSHAAASTAKVPTDTIVQ